MSFRVKAFCAACLSCCAALALGQSYFNGDPKILLPLSGEDRPGAMHSDCLLLNPAYAIHPDTILPGGYTPAQIRGAYNVPSSGGSGAIAVVDAYDLSSALGDFNTFSSEFSLPTESSTNVTSSSNSVFQVVYATGTKPGDGQANQWDMESVLDIEWAHAMAPKAKIYLVEAASSGSSDLLFAAQVASKLAGVKEVSMSWGGGEFSGESSLDSSYFGQSGVVFFASSGDKATQEYPSESANVVSVGGTTLNLSGSAWSSETGWSDSGGGPSADESRPSFQNSVESVVGSMRGDPDVSAVANPNTGVDVYSSVAFTSLGGDWEILGGTSLASPVVTGITNVRETELNSFASNSQAEEFRIYDNLMGPSFRDITSGSTAHESCAAGWDYVTGVGAPNGLMAAWSRQRGNVPANGIGFGSAAANMQRWSFQTGGAIPAATGSAAVGADGTVYFESQDKKVYAVDGPTGATKWTYTTGGSLSGCPAIGSDGTIYVGASDGNLYAINGSTGTLKWEFPAEGPIVSSAAVAQDGTVYFGAEDQVFYAINGSTGNMNWAKATQDVIETTPVIGPDGTVYIGSNDKNIYAISNGDTQKWSFTTGSAVDSSPALGSNGYLYFGSNDDKVYALNASTGAKVWSYTTGGAVTSSPAVGLDGTVYVGSNDGKFYAFNGTTGALSWSYTTGGEVQGSPAIDSAGNVYDGSNDGNLYSFVGSTGSKNWSFNVGNSVGSPAIASDGTVYVGSTNDYVDAIGTNMFAGVSATSSVTGGSSGSGTVTLEYAAYSNLPVYLSSGNSALTISASPVTISAGQTQANFSFNTSAVSSATSVTITASNNSSGVTTSVTVEPFALSNFYFSPTSITGTLGTTGYVVLAGNAGPSGNVVSLSSPSSDVIVPSTVTVASGTTTQFFYVRTSSVSSPTTVTVTASFNGVNMQSNVTIEPAALFKVYASPSTVTGGSSTSGVVDLSSAAGSGGNVVSLQTGNSCATVPSTVTVAAGKESANFTITTTTVASQQNVTLTATFNSASVQSTLTVNPYAVSNFYASPSTVVGRYRSVGVVQLAGPAGTGGNVVSILSNNSAATVPLTVTVPAGSKGVSFTITTAAVSTQQTVTLTATFNSVNTTTTLMVDPDGFSKLYASPNPVTGGLSTTGVVQMLYAAGSGGDVVFLSSGSPDATVPASVTVPSGSTGVSFPITTSAVSSSESVTLTASFEGLFTTYILTVNPYPIKNFYCSPSSVTGGRSTYGVVQLSGPAGPSGDVVALSSSSSAVVPPATVTVPAGKTGVSFLVSTTATANVQTVTLTATLGSSSAQASLMVNP